MPRPPSLNWPVIAEALALRVPRKTLHSAVLAWAATSPVGPLHRRQALAFSGGADSLALVLLTWAHWPETRGHWTALHFDHRLRGRASTADAAFCEKVCSALKISFVGGHWETAVAGASEATARTARLAFFKKELSRRRINALWFGHQQDDIAETLLMRLARGSGTGGLSAPRPVHQMPAGRVHLRPLLTVKKTTLVAALTDAGAVWREDASNQTGTYTRNRLRLDVLPAWQGTVDTRDALAGAALSRELLEEDDTALEAWVDLLAPLNADGSLNVTNLAGKPRAVVRRALHRWLLAQNDTGDLSRQGFEGLLALLEKGAPTRFSLGADGFAVLRKNRLFFEKKSGRKTE